MSQLIASFRREPALYVGFFFSVVVIVAQQSLASGIVTSTGAVNVLNLVIALVPQIAGFLIRGFVSPVPVRPEGG